MFEKFGQVLAQIMTKIWKSEKIEKYELKTIRNTKNYPKRANELGVPFCFGDDSHSIEEVGAFLDQGRDYLLANGVETITTLTRRNKTISKKIIPLI